MLYEYRVLVWQLVAYIKQSLKSAEWRKRGYMLIYDRQKWGDFSKGEEIPLLVLSLKILIAVDFPSSYFWIFSPYETRWDLSHPTRFSILAELSALCTDLLSGSLLFPAPLRSMIHFFQVLLPFYRKFEFLAARVCSLIIQFYSTHHFFSGGP